MCVLHIQVSKCQFRPISGQNRPQRPNRPNLPDLRRPNRQSSPNRPPVLQTGNDLVGFEIEEDTPVGTAVYTLKAVDPEGAPVLYTISDYNGDHFSINKETGVITLKTPLDREEEDELEVIFTINDLTTIETFQRRVKVIDKNDNRPRFSQTVYNFDVDETVPVDTRLFMQIVVTDEDQGENSRIKLTCVQEDSPDACETFDIKEQVSNVD